MRENLKWIIGFLSVSMAQETQPAPRAVLKVMPLAIVDPFQYTLHGGVELPFGLSNTIQAEGGWVFGYLGETSTSEFKQQGFKLRLSWREYFAQKVRKHGSSYIIQGGFAAIMGSYQFYKQSLQIDTSLGYGYFREYERNIQSFEIAFLLGYHTQLGQRLSLDFWGGIGARYAAHRWEPGRPSYLGLSAPLLPVGDIIIRPGGRPVPRLGIAIGWILR